jgi:hypothetical protein
MPEIEIIAEIEVYCSCGEGLCRQTSTGRTSGRHQPYFTVEPCQKCLNNSEEAGYIRGYSAKEKEIE